MTKGPLTYLISHRLVYFDCRYEIYSILYLSILSIVIHRDMAIIDMVIPLGIIWCFRYSIFHSYELIILLCFFCLPMLTWIENINSKKMHTDAAVYMTAMRLYCSRMKPCIALYSYRPLLRKTKLCNK